MWLDSIEIPTRLNEHHAHFVLVSFHTLPFIRLYLFFFVLLWGPVVLVFKNHSQNRFYVLPLLIYCKDQNHVRKTEDCYPQSVWSSDPETNPHREWFGRSDFSGSVHWPARWFHSESRRWCTDCHQRIYRHLSTILSTAGTNHVRDLTIPITRRPNRAEYKYEYEEEEEGQRGRRDGCQCVDSSRRCTVGLRSDRW